MAASPLEGFGNTTWVCFQRALVVRDIFTGGKRTFFSREDARDFRGRIYARNGDSPYPNLSLEIKWKASVTHRCLQKPCHAQQRKGRRGVMHAWAIHQKPQNPF